VRKTITQTYLGIGPEIVGLLDGIFGDRPLIESGDAFFDILVPNTGITLFRRTFDVVTSGKTVEFVDPDGRAVPTKEAVPTPGDDVLASAMADEDRPFATAEDTASVGETDNIGERIANAGISIVIGGVIVTQADSPIIGPADAIGLGVAVSGSIVFGVGKTISSVIELLQEKPQKSVDDLISESKPIKRKKAKRKRKTDLRENDGGFDRANDEFDSVVDPSTVKPINTKHGPGRTGKTPDGRNITVRPGSTDGRPTIEIRPPGGGRGTEIRFNN